MVCPTIQLNLEQSETQREQFTLEFGQLRSLSSPWLLSLQSFLFS